MTTVTEVIDAFPVALPTLTIERREDLLLAEPLTASLKIWPDRRPIEAVHFPQEYEEGSFAPPREVYAHKHLRIEWQKMNSRQPFYHRNTDADEISLQVAGERTLMTELGTVELRPGDLSMIPVGVGHDNYGRRDIHVLFYLPAPVDELTPPARTSEMRIPPYDGWKPATVNEFVSKELGSVDGGIIAFPADEELLLRSAEKAERKIGVVRADEPGVRWLYQTPLVRIGTVRLDRADGQEYVRHGNCEEMQYQISGRRTLVTQRGTLRLEPGDFVDIPLGVAFTSITEGESRHITVLSGPAFTPVAAPTKTAEFLSADELRPRTATAIG